MGSKEGGVWLANWVAVVVVVMAVVVVVVWLYVLYVDMRI
jgi:hypothetical protein